MSSVNSRSENSNIFQDKPHTISKLSPIRLRISPKNKKRREDSPKDVADLAKIFPHWNLVLAA